VAAVPPPTKDQEQLQPAGKNIEVVQVLASYRCSVQLRLARNEYVYCSDFLGDKTPRSLDYRVEMAEAEILEFVWGMVNNGIIKLNLIKGNSMMLSS
jgi:hypothetical protein